MAIRARRTSILFGWAIGAVALIAAGCGSSSTTSTPTTASSGGSGGGTQVTVGETEFKLALSTTTFTPGAYTFIAVNNGKTTHALKITGTGVNSGTNPIDPGQKADLHVTLQAGSYDVFCPTDGHKSLGMDTEITVGAAGSGAAAGAATTTPVTSTPATTSGGSGGGPT